MVHEDRLGLLVDMEGDVSPDRDAGVAAGGVRPQRGEHDLTQAAGEADEAVGDVGQGLPILPCYTAPADRRSSTARPRDHDSSARHSMTAPPAPAGTVAYRAGDSLYLNITNRCSSACEFCLREWTDGVYGVDLRLDHEPALAEVTQAIEVAFLDGPADEVVFCGFGEPTMRLDLVLAVTEWLRLRRIRSRLDTNGHGELLNPEMDVPAALAAAGLDAVTVSLNAATPEEYDRVCRPVFTKSYRAVLRFAEQCLAHGIETTLTAVDYPGADLPAVADLAAALGAGFRARGYAAPRTRAAAEKGDH